MPDSLKRIRIAWLCVFAFLLNLSYAIARPGTESLFLQEHGSQQLPVAWVVVALGVISVVVIYNRFVDRSDLVLLFGVISALSGAVLIVLLSACSAGVWGATYLLYAWKEIYMVILVEVYYSFANAVFPIRTARWMYGLFGAVGAAGGVVGNLAGGQLALQVGTTNALWFVLAPLALLFVASFFFARSAGIRDASSAQPVRTGTLSAAGEAWKVTRTSSYLLLVLLTVVLAQVVVTTVDFEYNRTLEVAFPDIDPRTAVTGRIYAIVQALTCTLHALSGVILRIAGVPLVLLAVPALLVLGLSAYAAVPSFASVAVIKVATKTFDYTLFRNAKELLYIPLSYTEITRGKSIIDMISYRLAKVGASALLLILMAIGAVFLVTPLTFVLILAWLIVTAGVVRRFRFSVSREEEMASRDADQSKSSS